MPFGSDSKMVQITGGPLLYYSEYTTTNAYIESVFGAGVHTITISNDSATDTISISFDGATLVGDLKLGESVTVETKTRTSIYIRGTAGGDNVRIWGW